MATEEKQAIPGLEKELTCSVSFPASTCLGRNQVARKLPAHYGIPPYM